MPEPVLGLRPRWWPCRSGSDTDDGRSDGDSNNWPKNWLFTELFCRCRVWHCLIVRQHCTCHTRLSLCIHNATVLGIDLSVLLSTMAIQYTHIKVWHLTVSSIICKAVIASEVTTLWRDIKMCPFIYLCVSCGGPKLGWWLPITGCWICR